VISRAIDLSGFKALVSGRVKVNALHAPARALRCGTKASTEKSSPAGVTPVLATVCKQNHAARSHRRLGTGTWTLRQMGVRMTQKTVTRADLAEAVYGTVGLSRTESAELVERVLELIGDALITGANVKLSSFGSFQVRSKNERIGRNPKTGEEVPILPRQVLVFKPSNVLKSKINKSMVRAGK
jgi:integration host factor subunit alpha